MEKKKKGRKAKLKKKVGRSLYLLPEQWAEIDEKLEGKETPLGEIFYKLLNEKALNERK